MSDKIRYQVVSKDGTEVTRTSRKAAEQDVCLLADICHKTAWIKEIGNE